MLNIKCDFVRFINYELQQKTIYKLDNCILSKYVTAT